jgi:HEAT repeat protein
MGDFSDANGLGLAELRSTLASPDSGTRVDALLRAPPEPGVQQLVIDALWDLEPEVRLAAVRTLVRLGGPRATRALMQAAAGDLSPPVRAEALAGLSRILEARGRRLPPQGT